MKKKYEKALLAISNLLLNNKVKTQEVEDLLKKYVSKKKEV